MAPLSPWWTPERHADRRPFLANRAAIKSAIRAWFEGQGFIEVDTACLQVSPGNETHLHALKTELTGTALGPRTLYLHTSPEFAMKKLLAAGEEKIFTFAPVFRDREQGPLHHPEFTMLEWYRSNAPYEVVMADAATLLALASQTSDNRYFSFRGRTANPRAEPERLSVAEAMSRYGGIDLLATITPHGNDRDRLGAMAAGAGIAPSADDTWSDIFSKVLTGLVEGRLGTGRATLLTDYPASEAALARVRSADPRVAERFELYCCGVELANGFGELTDPIEQRRRLQSQMAEKERIYGERLPLDEDFLAALAHMPPASGCALGFDRLVMLATGALRIEQVIWTPVTETGN